MYLNDWIVQRDPLAQGFVDLDLQGFVDLDLGSSPGWWAAIVATYCQSRTVEHPKSKSTNPSLRGHGTPCNSHRSEKHVAWRGVYFRWLTYYNHKNKLLVTKTVCHLRHWRA